ncbi:S8 family serine peptidase [bacterium]|nr:S8 family serine peptidase [bacterium]
MTRLGIKNLMLFWGVAFLLSIFVLNPVSAASAQNKILAKTNQGHLQVLAAQHQQQHDQDHLKIQAYLARTGEKRRQLSRYEKIDKDGKMVTHQSTLELVGFNQAAQPIYLMTDNATAAKTIVTDLVWPGGSAGLSLTGSGITIAEWDAGSALSTHQELAGRITLGDGAASNYHSTHVAGTILASGVVSLAKGMAYESQLVSYDWTNDLAEMATEASGGLLLSNHSYGTARGWRYDSSATPSWYWYGYPAISETEDYKFGFYNYKARAIDRIANDAPYYLIIKSAGNDRTNDGPDPGGEHWVFDGTWVVSTVTRNPDGDYNTIGPASAAKNNLCVGAVNDIAGGYTDPTDVVIAAFSNFGPTDDGRIKPDLVANGISLYSSYNTSDTAYAFSSGTSMSTPSVTGSLILLQQHYQNTHSNDSLLASALKTLVIHTADEAGIADGPDYTFGWGLFNTASAAQLITEDTTTAKRIEDHDLFNDQEIVLTLSSDGLSPLKATMVWNDPAGPPLASQLNPITPMLVNDLDLRLIRNSNQQIYYPWTLDGMQPTLAAVPGDNTLDNIEQVWIQSPVSGNYTLRITHKGTLSGGRQTVSLIITGATTIVLSTPTATSTPEGSPTHTPSITMTATISPTSTVSPVVSPTPTAIHTSTVTVTSTCTPTPIPILPIYRSLGPAQTTALAHGTAGFSLNITGSIATFSSPLPDQIGLGDALQYDADNNTSIDQIAFVHQRLSSTQYMVKNAAGGLPLSTVTNDEDWSIYRAYTSLLAAEEGSENAGIDPAVQNFDTWSGGDDLAANYQIWHLACYADAVDTTPVTFSGWITSSQCFIRIFTPNAADEVGISQRHNGVYDNASAYALEVANSTAINVAVDHLYLEGMQLALTSVSGTGQVVVNINNPGVGEFRLSGSIIKGIRTNKSDHCGLYLVNGGTGTLKLWNNLFYDFEKQGSSTPTAILLDDADYNSTIYNQTLYNCEQGLVLFSGQALLKNNITQACGDGYIGTFDVAADYNISDIAGDTTGLSPSYQSGLSTVVSFINTGSEDFHLAGDDTTAKDQGTNLSNDLIWPFDTDIDGQWRSSPWDIGMDEQNAGIVTATVTGTGSPSPTATPTSTSTLTITPSSTVVPSSTFSVTPSPTALLSATHTPTMTATATSTLTYTVTPQMTHTITDTATPELPLTASPTSTISITMTSTLTMTPTLTALATSSTTPTSLATHTLTPLVTPSGTMTLTWTETYTPTPTPTFSVQPTSSSTSTRTVTLTPEPLFPSITAIASISSTPAIMTLTLTPVETATASPTDEKKNPIIIYPQPARNQMRFRLNLSAPGAVKINIYNYSGEWVAQLIHPWLNSGTDVIVWDCSSMAAGIYIVQVLVDCKIKDTLNVAVVK